MKNSFQDSGRPNQPHIIDRIRRRNAKFSGKQKLIADYFVRNYKQAAFLNSSGLARVLKVSQATLYRFALFLGYSGFPRMQRALQEMVLGELTTEDRLSLSSDGIQSKPRGRRYSREVFDRVLLSEIETMKRVLGSLKKEDFDRAIEVMFQAERIVIVGLLGSAALAQYFAYNLRKLRPDVILIQRGDAEDLVKFRMVDASSVVIVITFPRYPVLTIKFAELARKQKAKIIGLTNDALSPIAALCDIGFYVPAQVVSFMDPFAAPISLIHALITEFSQRDIVLTRRQLGDYEKIAKREKLFYSS